MPHILPELLKKKDGSKIQIPNSGAKKAGIQRVPNIGIQKPKNKGATVKKTIKSSAPGKHIAGKALHSVKVLLFLDIYIFLYVYY